MMNDFEVTEMEENNVRVTSERFRLKLTYFPDTRLKFKFEDESHSEGKIIPLPISITARDLEKILDGGAYYAEVAQLARNPELHLQYVEIGAGLGEFTPRLAYAGLKHKPIVIDQANYNVMLGMLLKVRPYLRGEDVTRYWDVVGRCLTMLDPDKVNLINMPFEDALEKHPELHGIGDVIVDYYGVCRWGCTEAKSFDEIATMVGKLLKPTGTLYADEFVMKYQPNGNLDVVRRVQN